MKEKFFAGASFLFPLNFNEHLHIILTEFDQDEKIAIVSISSLSRNPNPDLTVVLDAGDHDFIKQPSIVLYGRAKIWTFEKINKELDNNSIKMLNPISNKSLLRIKEGVFESMWTPQKFQNFCRSNIVF